MKSVMNWFTKITDAITNFFSAISMVVIMFLMCAICVDIVTGNIMDSPIPGMYELCQVVLSTVVFTTWAYTQSKHGHIHVTMFVAKMPQVLRFICFGITSLLSTVTMVIAAYAVYFAILDKKKSGECTGTLLIPYWPFFIFEFIAFILLALLLFKDTIKAFWAIGSKEVADEIQATW